MSAQCYDQLYNLTASSGNGPVSFHIEYHRHNPTTVNCPQLFLCILLKIAGNHSLDARQDLRSHCVPARTSLSRTPCHITVLDLTISFSGRAKFYVVSRLAALLSIELKADLLMLMTDVPGVYTGPPKDPRSKLISTYCPEIHDPIVKFGDKSSGGRGGMTAKVHTEHALLYRLASLHALNQRCSQENFWLSCVLNRKQFLYCQLLM